MATAISLRGHPGTLARTGFKKGVIFCLQGESVQGGRSLVVILVSTALLVGIMAPNAESIEETENAEPLPHQLVVLPAATIIGNLVAENRLHVLLPGTTLDAILTRSEFVDPDAKKEFHTASGVEIIGPSYPVPMLRGELVDDPGSFVQVMVLGYGFNVMYRPSHEIGSLREYSFLESAAKEGTPTDADLYQWSSRSLGPASQNQLTPDLIHPMTIEDCSDPELWAHEDVVVDGDAAFKGQAGPDWDQHQSEEVGSASGVYFDYSCVILSIHGHVWHDFSVYDTAECTGFRTQVETHWETEHVLWWRNFVTALSGQDLYSVLEDGTLGYGTAGCAIVGGCCYPAKATSYAVLEWTEPVSGFDSLRRLTLNAHEAGHLYSAKHEDDPAYNCPAGSTTPCPCGPSATVKCRIMSAVYMGATGNEAAFGPVSANSIRVYAAS